MDMYPVVTKKIVDLIEDGQVPHCMRWSAHGLPRNLISNEPYRGINLFLLSPRWHPQIKYDAPYPFWHSPFWLTMKQARQLGGSVRRGEHGRMVVFWDADQIPDLDWCGAIKYKDGSYDERVGDPYLRPGKRFVLRYHRLFNLEQCELPQAVLAKLPEIEARQPNPIQAIEQIIAGNAQSTRD
jgi:antirestriction protein ArdC